MFESIKFVSIAIIIILTYFSFYFLEKHWKQPSSFRYIVLKSEEKKAEIVK